MRKKALWLQLPRFRTRKPEPEKKRKPLRRISTSQIVERKMYLQVRAVFLAKEENRFCVVCKTKRASHVHHRRGRSGKLLCAAEYFLAVCWGCHERIHRETGWAVKKGWLAGKGEWGKQN